MSGPSAADGVEPVNLLDHGRLVARRLSPTAYDYYARRAAA